MTDRWDEEELKRAKEITRQIEQEFAPALHGEEADLGAVVGIIAAARRAAHEAGIEREWKPIESAPKDGTSIIYLDRRECIGEAFWQDKDEHEPGWWDEANTEEVKPTHWMPRPNLPAEGSRAAALPPTTGGAK